MSFRSLNLMLLFILVFPSGCKETTTVYPTASPISPIIAVNTSTAIPSPNPSITATFSVTSTVTPQPTSTITLTPLPIIPKDKVRAKFDQLYVYNNGCSLPCWWGITPGVTTWGETLHFLHQFDEVGGIVEVQQYPLIENPSPFTLARWQFPSPLRDFTTGADFEVQNGVVVAISIAGDVGHWMFPEKKLYTEYGQPNQVFIVTGSCQENQNACDAVLYLLYDENNFMIVYSAFGTINNKTVPLCIAGYSDITMWAPSESIDLNARKLPDSEFIPLQTHIFSEDAKSNEIRNCVDVPIDLWRK